MVDYVVFDTVTALDVLILNASQTMLAVGGGGIAVVLDIDVNRPGTFHSSVLIDSRLTLLKACSHPTQGGEWYH